MREPDFSRTRRIPVSSLALAYVCLGIAVLSLGFSAIFIRWANAPGPVAGFYRMAIAVVVLAILFFRQRRNIQPLPRAGLYLAILGGVLFAADLSFWATGVMIGGATNPTLLANAAPIWVGLGAVILFHEKLRSGFWLGLLVAISGAAIILGIDSITAIELGYGSMLGLLASVFYAGYFLATQLGRKSLDSLTYFWLAALSSTLVLLVICLVLRQPIIGYTNFTYLNFIAMGLITQVTGYLAISFALGILPASIVSPTLLGQPVATAVLAAILLGEQLTPWQVIGGIAVLLGVFIVYRSRESE